MIEKSVAFDLPQPWIGGRFETTKIGSINFIVGPNGSGKSRFARSLAAHLPKSRILGTDRLSGMETSNPMRSYFGDNFASGYAKNHFQYLKQAGQDGLGIDTLVLLDERMDLRIQVEATLGHLFNRQIFLEWDSGNLVARATLGENGASYRLDRDECHGIKELLVLLTHLYNDDYDYLVIDEPELNLHPQFQAFFMQEVRKIAGDPTLSRQKKAIFLITHSPFILDFRSIEDVKAVISFSLDHSLPKQILDLDANATTRLSSLVPRLNVHHKQFFFSDNPIFVEGILDAQFIEAVQDSRGVSIAGAGSCVIDAGGCEEVNRYLELCLKFGKQAHFVYDLDSLFNGNLRACVKQDGTVQNFLAMAGVGGDFGRYCGELDKQLTIVVDKILGNLRLAAPLDKLFEFLNSLGDRKSWEAGQFGRARVAVLTAISRFGDDMRAVVGSAAVAEVTGRLAKVSDALREKNVHLLTGGTLERYMPSYTGNVYKLEDEAKRRAVEDELNFLSTPVSDASLAARYGELHQVMLRLPSKPHVDPGPVLRRYLGRYIHELQAAIVQHPQWTIEEIRRHLLVVQQPTTKVFSLEDFHRGDDGKFRAIVGIVDMLGQGPKSVVVDQLTNAGVGGFDIITLNDSSASAVPEAGAAPSTSVPV